jgi:hypothetical protein
MLDTCVALDGVMALVLFSFSSLSFVVWFQEKVSSQTSGVTRDAFVCGRYRNATMVG